MIGDAPGDYKLPPRPTSRFSIRSTPGGEEKSWERFFKEGIEKFLRMRANSPENTRKQLLDEFDSYLPELPPWEKK